MRKTRKRRDDKLWEKNVSVRGQWSQMLPYKVHLRKNDIS